MAGERTKIQGKNRLNSNDLCAIFLCVESHSEFSSFLANQKKVSAKTEGTKDRASIQQCVHGNSLLWWTLILELNHRQKIEDFRTSTNLLFLSTTQQAFPTSFSFVIANLQLAFGGAFPFALIASFGDMTNMRQPSKCQSFELWSAIHLTSL